MMMNGRWLENVERLLERLQQFVQRVGQRLLDAFGRLESCRAWRAASAHVAGAGRFHADVAGQQQASSSSSSSSSTLPREKIDLSLPPNWARVRARPAFRRSRQEGACARSEWWRLRAGGFLQETKHEGSVS
jgi:hypothetical protein